MVLCTQNEGQTRTARRGRKGYTMKTMTIGGVNFHLTTKTYVRIQRRRAAEKAERFWFDQLKAEEAETRETGNWDVYSDLYKSMYGVRPRWMCV